MRVLTLLWLFGAPPCADLPLEPGTSWTYAAKVSWTPTGSAVVHDTSLVWRTSILSLQASSSIRVATVRNWPSDLAWWDPTRKEDVSIIVCRGDHVYHLGAPPGDVAAVVDSLLAGTRTPARDLLLRFPLAVGTLLGRDSTEREDTFYAWYVESAEPIGPDLRRRGVREADSVVTITYRTLPDHQVMMFVRGIGLVGYTYVHHGTVAAAEARLTAFEPPARD